VKDHARRIERRLAVESNERLEPGPDESPGLRARRPVGDRLVEERFSETLRGQIGPVDRGAGPEKSNLTGVQRARSASSIRRAAIGSVVRKSDQESAHDQRSG